MITLLVPYSISFLFGGVFALNGGSNDRDQYGSLLVPIAGPFISIGVGRANGSSVHESEVFFMLADGFAQTAGAAMIVASILVPGKTLERVAALPGKPEVFVGPGSAYLRMRF